MVLCGLGRANVYAQTSADCTSYVYCGGDTEGRTIAEWYQNTDVASVGFNNKIKKSTQNAVSFLGLPPLWHESANPEIKTVRFAGESYVKVPSDKTALIYMSRKNIKLLNSDSLYMFLPFGKNNINNYSISSYGIRAKYIDIHYDMPPHLSICLGNNSMSRFPWEVFWAVVIGIVFVLTAKNFQPGYISRLYPIIFYYNTFTGIYGERNVNADRAAIMLILNYILNAALFCTVALLRYDLVDSINFTNLFLVLCAAFTLFYLLKRVISYMLSQIFCCEDIYALYYGNVSYLLQALGVFLLCVNIGNLYIKVEWLSDIMFWTTAIGCIVGESIKILRLFKIIFKKHFPYFYLFLYLCGVELMPIMLIVKMLSR